MLLTFSQLTTLRAAIDADPALAAYPRTDDGAFAIASAFNALAAPLFYVWSTSVPTDAVYNAITWANLTPSGAPDGTASYTNRALACQGRQLNVQALLQGQGSINGARASIRNGLQDALTDVPSGASGNLRQAGWPSVQIALTRQATRGEQLYANTTNGTGATNTAPAQLVVEGAITAGDVTTARNL